MKNLLITAWCVFVLSACANNNVKPWERGYLANDEMSMKPNINDTIDDHVYFSKEATSGGRGFGGGGCGCN